MMKSFSKSRFKAQALAIFREVEQSGKSVLITDRGRPVLTLAPFRPDPEGALRVLRESVTQYNAPFDPVGQDDWESNQ